MKRTHLFSFKYLPFRLLPRSLVRSLIHGAIGLVLTLLPIMFISLPAQSITVSPQGVNVNTFGSTSVFLTFIGLNGFRPVEGLWCGAINPDQSCVAGTVFGRLPRRSDRGRLSGGNNYTDIMSIPPSVSRRAYQDALRGNSSEFFYVRRFVSDGALPDVFVAVTCRLTGGGARVPLALTNVRIRFDNNTTEAVPVIPRDQDLPPFSAEITYNGTGRLKGRWELVRPGDIPPTENDLLPEASLPIEQRALQQRYTVIDRFETFLMPTGRVKIPGPNPDRIPKGTDGLHLILFRVEASDEREGISSTGDQIVSSGGVAGFPMPVLRYYIGSAADPNSLTLVQPKADEKIAAGQVVEFQWQPIANAQTYRLDVLSGETVVLSALLDGNTPRYTAPPWLKDQAGKPLSWRVKAIDSDNKTLVESAPQAFSIQPNTP
jgi:hypothetical protein